MQIKKVGIVGCGLMGSGIAQVSADSGYETVVHEVDDKILAKGLNAIEHFLSRSVKKGKLTEERKRDVLGRIRGTTRLEDLQSSDLIIEAIVENLQAKTDLYRALDDIVGPDAIFASNTSSLCITQMAANTRRPARFVGLHFFNSSSAHESRGDCLDDHDRAGSLGVGDGFRVLVGQDSHTVRRSSRLRGESAPGSFPVGFDTCAGGRRGDERRHRHWHEARLRTPDGTPRAHGFRGGWTRRFTSPTSCMTSSERSASRHLPFCVEWSWRVCWAANRARVSMITRERV